jgi:replicative DNA helicase
MPLDTAQPKEMQRLIKADASKSPFSSFVNPEPEQVLPHNVEVEQALLGALMINNAELDHVSDVLKADDFFAPIHGKIYEAILNLGASGKQANAITLKTFFQNEEPIGELSVPLYLVRLEYHCTSTINARHYAQTVSDLSLRRKMIEIADHMRSVAHNAPIDANPVQQIDAINQTLLDLSCGGHTASFGHVSDGLRGLYQRLDGQTERAIKTGFQSLDNIIGGLHKRRLIIIGARPKQGKTALLQSMMMNLLLQDVPTCFFSLELGKDEVKLRFVSMLADIPFEQLSNGTYDRARMGDIKEAFKTISKWPLYIDTLPSRTTSALASRTRNAVKKNGVKAVFVDYLTKLTVDRRFSGRYDEVTGVCLDLEEIKKDQEIPMIVAAQLSRRGVQTATSQKDYEKFNPESYRPTDTDLRDSGQIEQSADQLLLLNRPEFYLRKLKPIDESKVFDWEIEMGNYKGKAEILVYFNRHGRDGDVQLSFDGPTMKFHEGHHGVH